MNDRLPNRERQRPVILYSHPSRADGCYRHLDVQALAGKRGAIHRNPISARRHAPQVQDSLMRASAAVLKLEIDLFQGIVQGHRLILGDQVTAMNPGGFTESLQAAKYGGACDPSCLQRSTIASYNGIP